MLNAGPSGAAPGVSSGPQPTASPGIHLLGWRPQEVSWGAALPLREVGTEAETGIPGSGALAPGSSVGAKELWERCGSQPDPWKPSRVPTRPVLREEMPLCSTLVLPSLEAASLGPSWGLAGRTLRAHQPPGNETKNFSESLRLVTPPYMHIPAGGQAQGRAAKSTLMWDEVRKAGLTSPAVPIVSHGT